MHYLNDFGLCFAVSLLFWVAVGSTQRTPSGQAKVFWAYFWTVSPFAAYAAYLSHIGRDQILMWVYIGLTAFLILSPLRLYWQARRMEQFVAQVAAHHKGLRHGRDKGAV